MSAAVSISTLRKLEAYAVPIQGTGEMVIVQRVKGLTLIPLSKCEKLGFSRKSIENKFNNGELTRFHENGAVKTDSRPTSTYFSLDEWEGLYI